MKRYYSIQQAERTADIYIFGDIVPFEFFEGDVSAYGIVQQIKDLDVDTINVHIDSYGGSVSEGWAIYNALREHPARINTYGDGFVASAALYPFLAGDSRYASNLSAYYFHEVMSSAYGYAKDLRAAANEAEVFTEIGIKAFTDRAGIAEEDVRQLMAEETWLSPEQALEYGIATAVIADDIPRHMQSAKKAFVQRFVQRPAEPPTEPPQQPAEPVQETGSIAQMLAGFFNAQI